MRLSAARFGLPSRKSLASHTYPIDVRDFYTILGINKSATADEIKSAYRMLARKLHPDVNKAPDAAKTFAEAQQAYEVLSDEAKRAQYDRFGPEAFAPGAVPPGARGAKATGRGPTWDEFRTGGGYGNASGSPFDYGDDDEVSSMFDSIFGQRAGPKAKASKGKAQRATRREQTTEESTPQDIRVDFVVAATGGSQRFTLVDASGTGTQSVDVKIPAGTREGSVLRVPGLFPKSPTPDVLVCVRIVPHDLFRRSDETQGSLDILLDLPLTIAEATLGATIEVPTLHGRVALTVPAGTASGRKLRLRGMGIASQGSTTSASSKGDLVVLCQIVPPNAPAISELEKDVLRRIANLGGNPRVGKMWQS